MKDYYKILGLPEDASNDQIRKAYRRLALKYHPDRNPGDPNAEERFKEIAEAYGVLIDPAKRSEYDRWRGLRAHERMAGGDFRYSQEKIFEDLFTDPRFSRIFQDLTREFERSGIRSDKRFFEQTFFGGRGIIFGGVFFWGPFGSGRMKIHGAPERPQMERTEIPQIQLPGFLKRLGKKIGDYLFGGQKALPQGFATRPQDLAYELTLPRADAEHGTWVKIAINRGEGRETLKVKIPPGTRSGKRLRLRGKGFQRGAESGDLYITVHVA